MAAVRLRGVALHTPAGRHHHTMAPMAGPAPAPATGWEDQGANSSQLESVGQKLGQLQQSLLAKQSYLAKVIRVQRRMLVEQRAVIDHLAAKLGREEEGLEEQFSAAVAKVPYVEGQDLLLEGAETGMGELEDGRFLSLQRRAMLIPEIKDIQEDKEDVDEDFYEDGDDDDNDSFITITTSDDENSDDTLENTSESNDSGVIEPEFDIQQKSYGVNPIFGKPLHRDSLDGHTVTTHKEFKYVKNSKWKPASKSKASSGAGKRAPVKSVIKRGDQKGDERREDMAIGQTRGAVLRVEQHAFNESCLI